MSKHLVFDEDGEFESLLASADGTTVDNKAELAEDLESGSEEEKLLFESDSDDDAPEDIGFSESREVALQKAKEALQQIHEDKSKAKEQRKKRDDLYKKQKQKRLDSKRLPEELLESLPSEPIKKKTKTHKDKEEENAGIGGSERVDDTIQSDDSAEFYDDGLEDYIPLDNSDKGIKAVSLKEFKAQRKTSVEKALEFRQSQLYGKTVNRISAKDRYSNLLKRQARCPGSKKISKVQNWR